MIALLPPAIRKYMSVCASHCILLPVTLKGSTSAVSFGAMYDWNIVEAKKGGVSSGVVKAPAARFGKDKSTVRAISVHCSQPGAASKVSHEATMIATIREAYIAKRAGNAFCSSGI